MHSKRKKSPFTGEGVDQKMRLANGGRKESALHLKSIIYGDTMDVWFLKRFAAHSENAPRFRRV